MATTLDKFADWMAVELSRKHAGQIVTPIVDRRIVQAKQNGGTIYEVRLSYHDASDRSTSTPENHRGDYWDCIGWLRSHGVLIDDSRF